MILQGVHGRRVAVTVLLLGTTLPSCPRADSTAAGHVRVAVAGNFAVPFEAMAGRFAQASGVAVESVSGSTGQLYAQIRNGAPFDVFLAADTVRPARLEAEDLVVAGSRFTYAVGQLVLFAPGWDSVGPPEEELQRRTIPHLAIANPTTAPYGAAAREALMHWGLWEQWEPLVVRGENVVQTFQFVASGAADAGFVARSLVVDEPPHRFRVVPPSAYSPIRQDAVLLRSAGDRTSAEALLRFLRSDEGVRILAEFGYRAGGAR